MLTSVLATLLLSYQLALSATPPLSILNGTARSFDIKTYCNAPHVIASDYSKPKARGAELVQVGVLMRHHKRAPVALSPNEREINLGQSWDCSDLQQFTYGGGGARLYHSIVTPPGHPFARQIWEGNCEEGQLTPGGFDDSRIHGKDLWGVYHRRLGFLSSVEPGEINVRTTYIDRTKQVASAVLAGMDPSSSTREWHAHAQSELIDSLVPNYKCPRANVLLAEAQAAPFWQDVLETNSALIEKFNTVLGLGDTTGTLWASSFLGYQDVVTARICNDHPLPCNAAGDCISEEDADKVFELANLEADYLYHTAEEASEYVQLTFGVLFFELADALESPEYPLVLVVGHDFSIIRLAAGLKIFPLHWPRLGSEIVIETWQVRHNKRFVRVLYDGKVVDSLKWVPLDDFLSLLRDQVPENIFDKCMSGPSGAAASGLHSTLLTMQRFDV